MIIDFNCTSTLTHHWSSVGAYLNFIKALDSQIEIWIPEYASSEIVDSLSGATKIHAKLYSPQYGPSSFLRYPTAWVLSFFAERIFPKIPFRKIKNRIKRYLLNYYLQEVENRIVEESRIFDLSLVVPTLDYLGLELTKRLSSRNTPISISIRRFGAESKSSFASGDELDQLLICAKISKETRIKIGITTLDLFEALKSNSEFSDNIFWCPLPPDLPKKNESLKLTNHLKIGFPGAAKKRKGTERIPEIAKLLIKSGFNFTIYFQKAPYEWEGYQDTIDRIHSEIQNYVELPAVITIKEFIAVFNSMDLVVLPYDSSSYSTADSGILYQAADRGIPIIYTKGCGFASEAKKYGVGFELDTLTNENIGQLLRIPLSAKFLSYNRDRAQATNSFLGIN